MDHGLYHLASTISIPPGTGIGEAAFVAQVQAGGPKREYPNDEGSYPKQGKKQMTQAQHKQKPQEHPGPWGLVHEARSTEQGHMEHGGWSMEHDGAWGMGF